MVGPYTARLRAVRVDPPLAALIVLGLVAVAGFGVRRRRARSAG